MSFVGPHDFAINDYLRRIPGFEGLPDHAAQLKHQTLGHVLSGELDAFEGESFVVEDGAGVLGIAIVDPKGALGIVTLDDEQKEVTVRTFAPLESAVLVKSSGLDSGDLVTPYRLTVEHDLLPSGKILHEARHKDGLVKAHRSFARAFGHLSDTD